MQIWCQFRIKILEKIAKEIAPSNGAIWDEFSEQSKHQKKHQSISTFLMQIRCKLNAQFGWG